MLAPISPTFCRFQIALLLFWWRLGRTEATRNFGVDLLDGAVEGRDLLEVGSEHEAVMLSHLACQSGFQLFFARTNASNGKRGQTDWVGLSLSDRMQNHAGCFPHHIADHVSQFQVGIFSGLLKPIDFSCTLFDQTDSIAGEISQFSLGG